jgi:hypothetical protein
VKIPTDLLLKAAGTGRRRCPQGNGSSEEAGAKGVELAVERAK